MFIILEWGWGVRVKLTHICSYISILLHVEVRPFLNLTITCHFDSNFSIATCTCTYNFLLFIAKTIAWLEIKHCFFFIVSALQLNFLWSVKNLNFGYHMMFLYIISNRKDACIIWLVFIGLMKNIICMCMFYFLLLNYRIYIHNVVYACYL